MYVDHCSLISLLISSTYESITENRDAQWWALQHKKKLGQVGVL